MKSIFLKTGALALLVVFLATPLESADSVYLKTGDLFSGKILRINDREVSIQLGSGGIVSFRRAQVQRVRRWIRGEIYPQVIVMDDEGNAINNDPDEGLDDPSPTAPSPPVIASDAPRDPDPIASIPVSNLPAVAIPGSDEIVAVRPDSAAVEPLQQVQALSGAQSALAEPDAAKETWSINAPAGFEARAEAEPIDILESWVEPVSQTLVTLALYEDNGSVEVFKQNVVREAPGATTPRIFRDIPLNRDGEGGFEGWILETEQDIAGTSIRQVQLFARGDTGTYVLRCTSPGFLYPGLSPSFEESLHSFRIYRSPAGTAPSIPASP